MKSSSSIADHGQTLAYRAGVVFVQISRQLEAIRTTLDSGVES